MSYYHTNTNHRPEYPIVYMEVYGSNRVIYRATAGSVMRRGVRKLAYGIMLEDMRTQEKQCIDDFSENLEYTIVFANDLIQREIRPSGLYNLALEYLSDSVRHRGKDNQILSSRKVFSR